MNIATVDKLVLPVRGGVMHGGGLHVKVWLADGWYQTTLRGDDLTMWGPFECSDDANEAAWNASTNGVKVHIYIDEGDPEFELIKGSLPPGEDGGYLVGEVRE